MRRLRAPTAILAPASLPKRLFALSAAVMATAAAVQAWSGIPPSVDFAPIELSSNIVALMGVVWAAIQLRTAWPDRAARAQWVAGLVGMTLLALDDCATEFVLPRLTEAQEMNLSIGIWLVAAGLIFACGRRYALKPWVSVLLGVGFGLQIVAQYAGWLAFRDVASDSGRNVLDYVNDAGELAATLAYLSGLLIAELAPGAARPAAPVVSPPQPASVRDTANRRSAKIIRLETRRRSAVRCEPLGVAFPQIYRVAGFAWTEANGAAGPERERVVRYSFSDVVDGVEEPEMEALERPDPLRDRGWVIVRHHRNADVLKGYLDACGEFPSPAFPVDRLVTNDGIFTVAHRPAPATGPASLMVYVASTEGLGFDASEWTFAIDPAGDHDLDRPLRRSIEQEVWVD